jgi:hypothetical protein
MKTYENPSLELLCVIDGDIITTSPGTETTPKDEYDGIWDLNIGK